MCCSFAVEEEEAWAAPSAPVLHNGVVDYYELLGVSFVIPYASPNSNAGLPPQVPAADVIGSPAFLCSFNGDMCDCFGIATRKDGIDLLTPDAAPT